MQILVDDMRRMFAEAKERGVDLRIAGSMIVGVAAAILNELNPDLTPEEIATEFAQIVIEGRKVIRT